MINNKEEIIDVTPEEFELLSSYNNSSPQDIYSQNTEEIIDVTPEEFELLTAELGDSESNNLPTKEVPSPEANNLLERFTGMTADEQKKVVGDIINLAVKAPTAAVSSVVDIFGTPFVNAGVDAYNAVAPDDYQLPYAQSAKQTAKQGVDYVAGKTGIDTTKPTKGYEGAELAFEVGLPGALSNKLQKLIQTVGTKDITALTGSIEKFITDLLKTVGSTNPRTLAGAIGAGEGAHFAKEEGGGALDQLEGGIVGAIGGEALAAASNPKNIVKGATKLATRLLGLGPKSIKTEALDAAQKIGLEGLPTSAVTDSIVNRYANELIGKTPFFGEKIKNDIQKTSKQFQSAWDKVLESVSPFAHKELQSADIYEKSNSFITDTDIFPTDLVLNKIKEIRKITKSPIYGKSGVALNETLDKLEKSLTPANSDKSLESLFNKQFTEENLAQFPENIRKQILNHANKVTKEAASSTYLPVKELINAKININEIMADKDLFNTKEGKRSLKLLEGIRDSVQDTLGAYGEKNPQWYKEFKEAEHLFGQRAKRTTLEKLLGMAMNDPNTGEPTYRSLVNIFSNPSNQGKLKNSLGEAKYKKLEDFVKVAQSMSSISQKILNPSGSATVGYVLLAIQSLALNGNAAPLLKASVGVGALTKLLTDKKFLNKAVQFAKEPTPTVAEKIDSIIKEHLGIGAQALSKQINNQEAIE